MSADQTGFIGSIPRPVLRAFLVRTGMVLVCMVCLALVYWSLICRLQPTNREHQKKALELSRLADEVEQLRMQLKASGPEETKAQYEQTGELLFADQKQLRGWQNQLRRQAPPLALDAKVKLDPARLYHGLEEKLAFVQANIEINPTTIIVATNYSAYQRLLKFSQDLQMAEKRCDLIELSVQGNSNSVHHASAVVQVFTKPIPLK